MLDRLTIQTLLRKHLSDTLTETEREQLRLELLSDDQPEDWKTIINELHLENTGDIYDPKITDQILDLILYEHPAQAPVITIKKRNILRWLSAAAIIILFGTGAYLWNITQKEQSQTVQTESKKTDIAPGGQRALLTLASGSTITLDSAANGQLTVENGSVIRKSGDEIIYDAGQLSRTGITYNTMSTPKGGQYQLTLPDGTKAWLNAASSITFPTAFNGKSREVKITGEVYFEVAKNKSKPFIVKTEKENITVLGTSFNINDYKDETGKISLIEGSVKVNEKILQPGQAFINGKIQQTNIEQDIAWKNGYFNFDGAQLPYIMRQLSRWYNIEVKYEGPVSKTTFRGKLSRDLNLSQIIRILRQMNVSFRIEGNILIVQQG